MKFFITGLLLFSITSMMAQDSLTVTEIHEAISKGYKPGFSVYIPKTNYKDIAGLWKKQLRNDGKADITEKKNELKLARTIVSGISSDSIDLFSKVIPSSSGSTGTNLSVFVLVGDTGFVTSKETPDVAAAIKSYIRSFAVNQYRNAIVRELTAGQKKLDYMKDELRRMERDNETSLKKINSNKKNNENLLEDINANTELLETKKDEIAGQAETARDVPPSDQKSDEEKKLKQMEKEKSKLQEKIISLKNKIDKNNSTIEALQKKSDLNTTSNIPAKKEQIENQKEIVSGLSRKLNSLR